MGYGRLSYTQDLLGQPQFLIMGPVKLLRATFVTLKSVVAWMINDTVTVDVGLETQCPILPLTFSRFPIRCLFCVLKPPFPSINHASQSGDLQSEVTSPGWQKRERERKKHDVISHRVQGPMREAFQNSHAFMLRAAPTRHCNSSISRGIVFHSLMSGNWAVPYHCCHLIIAVGPVAS